MEVLFFGIEVEILEGLESPDRDSLLREAANAYRARARTLAALGEAAAARKDNQRADKLEAEAKQTVARAAKDKPADASPMLPGFGQVQLVNTFGQPANVILDGTTYSLQIGERKTIPKPAGGFTVQLPGGAPARGEVVAGKVVTIRVVSEVGRE